MVQKLSRKERRQQQHKEGSVNPPRQDNLKLENVRPLTENQQKAFC